MVVMFFGSGAIALPSHSKNKLKDPEINLLQFLDQSVGLIAVTERLRSIISISGLSHPHPHTDDIGLPTVKIFSSQKSPPPAPLNDSFSHPSA